MEWVKLELICKILVINRLTRLNPVLHFKQKLLIQFPMTGFNMKYDTGLKLVKHEILFHQGLWSPTYF